MFDSDVEILFGEMRIDLLLGWSLLKLGPTSSDFVASIGRRLVARKYDAGELSNDFDW